MRGFEAREARFPFTGEPGSVRRMDWSLRASTGPARVRGHVLLDGRIVQGLAGTVSWRGPTRAGTVRFTDWSFVFEVEAGELRLTATLDLVPGRASEEVLVRVQPGEQRLCVLDVPAPGATLEGSVRFDDGTPVAGIEVCAVWPERDEFAPRRALTDDSGAFRMSVPDVGLPFLVWTTGFDGLRLEFAEVKAGTHDVDFVLKRGQRLFLRAREARSGAALVLGRDVDLRARVPGSRGFWSLEPVSPAPDPDGWYEFHTLLREADFVALPRAEALPLHAPCVRSRVMLAGAEPVRLEFVLERGVELELALAEDAAPWPDDHALYLVEEELWDEIRNFRRLRPGAEEELADRRHVRFDAQDQARLSGLSRGLYRFKVQPPDVSIEPESVSVEAGTPRVRVRWTRAK